LASYETTAYLELAMIALFKGSLPAAVLTLVVALVIGSNGSNGGFLFIHKVHVASINAISMSSFSFYWSWPLFIASAALAFFIFTMMD
jgi:hypothetical protein